MLRSLYVLGIYLSFIAMGAIVPFVFSLGYLWTDLFRPQLVAYIILPAVPVSFIMGALAVGGYVLLDRRAPPPITLVFVLTILLGMWITLTTIFLAVAPESAWLKWDWAVKTVLFSAFIPFVIRSRIQIEAFTQVYLFGVFIHILPTGLKTVISGGGYGRELGLVGGNTGFGEGSTLATVAVMMIPVIFWLIKHNLLMPRLKIVRLGYLGMAVVALACTVGTYARTGLVGLVVVGGVMWLRSKRKIGFGIIIAAGALLVGVLASDKWDERISTIDDYQTESSSLGRILVWQWTMRFVQSNPFGGGFDSYRINEITFPSPDGSSEGSVVKGKAFHNSYFEMLGEHGWPGLILFSGLILSAMLALQRTASWAKRTPGMEWCRELALCQQTALVTLVVCGMFIGIAFQPMYWYIFAMSTILTNYRRRAQLEVQVRPSPVTPTRGELPTPVPTSSSSGWRDRYQPAPPAGVMSRGWVGKSAARSTN
jgi:probable O-glycosylation ligase (exosortase A-associated)